MWSRHLTVYKQKNCFHSCRSMVDELVLKVLQGLSGMYDSRVQQKVPLVNSLLIVCYELWHCLHNVARSHNTTNQNK